MPHGETCTGKASIKVKVKQDADEASERLVPKRARKRHLIFPLPKTGSTVCKMSAMVALESGETQFS